MRACFVCGCPRSNTKRPCEYCLEKNNAYMPTPEEIQAECIALRMSWPQARIDREEMATPELETPVIGRATDHRRRKSDNRD